MKVFIFALILVVASGWAQADQVGPFETDYCTNYPEGTTKEPELWKHCCLMHDMYFWAGGNRDDRDQADLELRSCIEQTGQKDIAKLMYWTVRATSYSPIKYSKKKWNNGWPQRPDSQTLTKEDVDQVEAEIFNGYDYISLEKKRYFIEQLRSRSY